MTPTLSSLTEPTEALSFGLIFTLRGAGPCPYGPEAQRIRPRNNYVGDYCLPVKCEAALLRWP